MSCGGRKNLIVSVQLASNFCGSYDEHANVAELVDALDLGSSAERRAGSIPVIRTIFFISTIL